MVTVLCWLYQLYPMLLVILKARLCQTCMGNRAAPTSIRNNGEQLWFYKPLEDLPPNFLAPSAMKVVTFTNTLLFRQWWIRWTNPNKSNVTSETSSSTCLASLLSFCAGVTSAEDKEMSSGNNRKHPNTRVETVFRLSSVRGSLAFFSVTQGRRYTLPRKQICTTRVCPVSPYCSEGQGDKNKKQYLYSMDWFQRTSRESVVFSPNIHYLQDASTLTVVSRERNIGPGGIECTT